jgi:hypothetical protein
MVRRGHPLSLRSDAVGIQDVLAYPIASTPLSDDVARALVVPCGPAAHPDACVTLSARRSRAWSMRRATAMPC